MGAPIEYFVRPVNGSDGVGVDGLSHATAWKTFEHAWTTLVRNSTHGDRVNVCSEGADVFTGIPAVDAGSNNAPAIVQGYTNTPGDGGIGILSGGGFWSISGAANNIFKDLKIMNMEGSAIFTSSGDNCRFENCWFTNINGDAISSDTGVCVVNCRFDEVAGNCVEAADGIVTGCHMLATASSTHKFTNAVIFTGVANEKIITNNIIVPSGGSGIDITVSTADALPDMHFIAHNSLFQTGAAGSTNGIIIRNDQGAGTNSIVINNLVEGFGTGISMSTTRNTALAAFNSLYNNTTPSSLGDIFLTFGNETLGATPFAKSGANDFANRLTYFQSVNTGSVRSALGSLFRARGAVQAIPASGSTPAGKQGLHKIEAGAA